LVASSSQGIECSFRRKHRLIVICVEIAPDHNAFNRWHCSSDHVMDMRQELSNSHFAFLNAPSGLRRSRVHARVERGGGSLKRQNTAA